MALSYSRPQHGEIRNIGGDKMAPHVSDNLVTTMSAPYDPKKKPVLPDEILYADNGLHIWNDIIWTKEFYQTHDEIALLDQHADDIVSRVQSGVTMIDLGAGDTRKVEHLLQAFERARKPATYLALDISMASLEKNVAYVSERHSGPGDVVRCAGLWGTFEDGDQYVKSISTARLFLSLGSVLCNDDWHRAVHNLQRWGEQLRPVDTLLVGMDAHLVHQDKEKIWAAYHSHDDLYRKFFLNGFQHANRLAGEEWFREDDWEFKATLEAEPTTRHRFFFQAKRDIPLETFGRTIQKGEEIDWFDSHKYGEKDVRIMCSRARLDVIEVWKASDSEFRQYLLKRLDNDADADSAVSGLD